MKLPHPSLAGGVPLEIAVNNRRCIRAFTSDHLTLKQFSQLLWSAQGITGNRGFKRSTPSAGALYPMDVYAVTGPAKVNGMNAAVYHYEPSGHAVTVIYEGDQRQLLARASLSQMWMAEAPINLVITAEYDRINVKYGHRGIRYAMIEAGHIAQNIFLMAESLGLGAGIVGAFEDQNVIRTLHLPKTHEPLLIMPVGGKSY